MLSTAALLYKMVIKKCNGFEMLMETKINIKILTQNFNCVSSTLLKAETASVGRQVSIKYAAEQEFPFIL